MCGVLSNAEEFGTWFRRRSEGPDLRARNHHPGYEQVRVDMLVERIEPQELLSSRWHPYAVDPAVDYTKEEPTLVT